MAVLKFLAGTARASRIAWYALRPRWLPRLLRCVGRCRISEIYPYLRSIGMVMAEQVLTDAQRTLEERKRGSEFVLSRKHHSQVI